MTALTDRVQSAYVEIDGYELRSRRKLLGHTIVNFAAMARISWGYLSQIERGNGRVSPPVFVRICDALELPPEQRGQLLRTDTPQQAAA